MENGDGYLRPLDMPDGYFLGSLLYFIEYSMVLYLPAKSSVMLTSVDNAPTVVLVCGWGAVRTWL